MLPSVIFGTLEKVGNGIEKGENRMKATGLDHIVLTTADLKACLAFYEGLLGMRAEEKDGRFSLFFGTQKFNIHTRPAEFLPAAAYPLAGSLDLCLAAEGDAEAAYEALAAKGAPLVSGVVTRHGARGPMKSIYLRDPDGNLVELGFYGS